MVLLLQLLRSQAEVQLILHQLQVLHLQQFPLLVVGLEVHNLDMYLLLTDTDKMEVPVEEVVETTSTKVAVLPVKVTTEVKEPRQAHLVLVAAVEPVQLEMMEQHLERLLMVV